MVVTLRRMFWLALLGGAGYVGWTSMQRRAHAGAITATAVEGRPMPAARAASGAPPFTTAPAPPATTERGDDVMQLAGLPDDVEAPTDTPRWVAPIDGVCPDGYPVKANANSRIYHVPGGRFYDRTTPERCYAHTADAEADGYRRAKA